MIFYSSFLHHVEVLLLILKMLRRTNTKSAINLKRLNTERRGIHDKDKLIKDSSKRNSWLDSLDWFAQPVQMFNFDGRSRIYTPPGVVCSLFLYIAMLSLLVDRSTSFLTRSSQTVTQIEMQRHEKNGFNLTT